jgi:ribosomal protein S1
VKVKVLRVDLNQKPAKISLSRKEVMQDPTAGKLEAIQVGETVTGRVTKIAEFGAFIEVAPGVEGLAHISELSHDRVATVDRVLKPDQVVTAKVLSVSYDPPSTGPRHGAPRGGARAASRPHTNAATPRKGQGAASSRRDRS